MVGGHVPRGGGARGPGRPRRPPAGRRGRSRLPPRRRLLERRGPGYRRRLPRSRAQPGERREEDFGTVFRVDGRAGAVHERHDGFIWEEASNYEESALRELPRRAPRPALPAEPLGPDRHRHPRPDDDGRGGLRRAHAPPPDPRPLRRRAPGPPPRLGARPPRPRRELGHPLRLRPRLHRLVLQLRELGRPAARRSSPPSAATRRGCSRPSTSRRSPRTPAPAPLASLDYIIANSVARAGSPATYVSIAQLRPCRRAGPRLARSARRRPPVRHQRLRRPEPRLPRPQRPSSAPRPRSGARSTG